MVHPRRSPNIEPSPFDFESTRREKPRVRIIVRRTPRTRRLLAHSVLTVNHEGFRGLQIEAQLHLGRRRAYPERGWAISTRAFGAPVAKPDFKARLRRAACSRAPRLIRSENRCFSRFASRTEKCPKYRFLSAQRLFDLRGAPGRSPTRKNVSMKGYFPPSESCRFSREIPPLRAERLVRAVVSGKLIVISGKRLPPTRRVRGRSAQYENGGQKSCE